MSPSEIEAARAALRRDRTIDIITTGARTGLERTTEIWVHLHRHVCGWLPGSTMA
jgi:hypothetical protein